MSRYSGCPVYWRFTANFPTNATALVDIIADELDSRGVKRVVVVGNFTKHDFEAIAYIHCQERLVMGSKTYQKFRWHSISSMRSTDEDFTSFMIKSDNPDFQQAFFDQDHSGLDPLQDRIIMNSNSSVESSDLEDEIKFHSLYDDMPPLESVPPLPPALERQNAAVLCPRCFSMFCYCDIELPLTLPVTPPSTPPAKFFNNPVA